MCHREGIRDHINFEGDRRQMRDETPIEVPMACRDVIKARV